MLRIIIPILIVVLVVVVLLAGKRGGLIRGVADDMLVSPARPAVAVAPRAGLKLTDARRAELAPTVQGSALPATSVQVCYALYQRPISEEQSIPQQPDAGDLLAGTAETAVSSPPVVVPAATPEHVTAVPLHEKSHADIRLVALLAVAESPYTWPVQPDTGMHDLHAFRQRKQELAGYFGFAETFVLPDADDPWSAVRDKSDDDPWREGSLVRRFTFMLWQHRAKLMIEYREPLPTSGTLPLVDDIPLLTEFEKRALESFAILNGDTRVEKFPRPEQNLPYPPETVNRRNLTAYLGELWNSRN